MGTRSVSGTIPEAKRDTFHSLLKFFLNYFLKRRLKNIVPQEQRVSDDTFGPECFTEINL